MAVGTDNNQLNTAAEETVMATAAVAASAVKSNGDGDNNQPNTAAKETAVEVMAMAKAMTTATATVTMGGSTHR